MSNIAEPLVEDGYEIGRLIAFALKSAKPSRDGEYKQLIDKYIYDDAFKEAADRVLEGLGLKILNDTTHALRTGLVLACDGFTSPFAPNIDSHARGLSREQQVALGIIHLAVMTWYYPQLDDDEDDDFRSRAGTPSEIAEDIRQVCETLRETNRNHDDEEAAPSQVRMAWEHFLSLQPAPVTRGNYMPKSTQVGLVNFALSELRSNGYLGVDGGEGPNTRYVSLPKYRVYVRRFAAHGVAALVREARRRSREHQKGDTEDV